MMNNIKILREQKGFNQKLLANKLGYSQTLVSKWELGVRDPDTQALLKMSQIFNVSIDELLGNDSFVKTNNFENMLPVPAEKRPTIETLCKLPEDAFQNVKGQIEIYAKYYGLI